MKNKEEFIAELGQAYSLKRAWRPSRLGWGLSFIFGLVVVGFGMQLLQPLAWSQTEKLSSISFAFESLLLLIQYLFSLGLVLRLSVPGPQKLSPIWVFISTWPILICLGLLISNYVLGVPLGVSIIQNGRGNCLFELLGFTLSLGLVLVWVCRRAYVVYPGLVSLHLALASMMVPLVYQEVFCLTSPKHSLLMHFTPGAVLVAILFFFYKRAIRGA